MNVVIKIDVPAAIRRMQKEVDLNDPRARSAIASALNYAARGVRSKARSILTNDLGFPSKRVRNSQFSTERANPARLKTTLYISGSPVPMIEFDGLRLSDDGIQVKYTDKLIKPGKGSFFQKTDWHKVQRTYDKQFAEGKAMTRNGRPLNFLEKKNADRVAIMESNSDKRLVPGSSSAFKGIEGATRTETDEVFGVSIATAVTMDKFDDKYDIYESNVIEKMFQDKLSELL